jgi:hypothetical protein
MRCLFIRSKDQPDGPPDSGQKRSFAGNKKNAPPKRGIYLEELAPAE